MQRQGIGGSAVIRIRAAGSVLLVVHLLVVAWLTLRPLDVPWVMPTNLHPFAGVRADLRLGRSEAVRRIAEDLLLLAPLGFLLPLAHGRPAASAPASLLRTVTAGALLSLAIALLQTGVPGRVVDVDSVLLNTTGVALAHLALVPAARSRLRHRGARRGPRGTGPETGPGAGPEEPAQGLTPTIPRVGIAP
ncbi:VanZ family protein [Streptomyces sp. NPDC101213]|uniref:VanZ family protein n=1 Tax=unclassified Streptomyces TaxID=2593676 RepID=UPI0036F6960D